MAGLFSNPFHQKGDQQRIYLDESGTLGYAGEQFTIAMILVHDLIKLEASTSKHRSTQSEVKASQMKTPQKLALARTLFEENDIEVFLARLDPVAAMASERRLDKEFLYDSMVAQALAFYLERGDLPRGVPYRVSMDMRGGLRESYEDIVAQSVGNVLTHRAEPLVTSLDVRFLDSRFSAGVQAADLFSNIYRTAIAVRDTQCQGFLDKAQADGRVHGGFTFGLPELANQMTQIAYDLRMLVETQRTAPGSGASAQQATASQATPAGATRQAPAGVAPTTAAGQTSAASQEQTPADQGQGQTRRTRTRRPTKNGQRRQDDGQAEAAVAVAVETVETVGVAESAGLDPDAGPVAEVASIVAEVETVAEEEAVEAVEAAAPSVEPTMGTSRSARRRRSRRAARERDAARALTESAETANAEAEAQA